MKNRGIYILLFGGLTAMVSCNEYNTKSHGPIRLGDSSAIVTEPDSLRLKDMVTDLKPNIPSESDTPVNNNTDTSHVKDAHIDSTKTASTQTTPAPQGQGLTVAFNEATIFIPGIATKSYRNQDPKRGNGVSYQLKSGTLNKGQLKVSAGTVTKISQRYQTVVLVKNSFGTLPLDALDVTTDWEPLKGAGGVYTITGLDAKELEYPKASATEIRNAMTKAFRAHRISRRKQNEWLNSIRRVRRITDAPLKTELRSVVWKIEGKDAKGRPFQKQLRIDLP